MRTFTADIYYTTGGFDAKVLFESGTYCLGDSSYDNQSLYTQPTLRTDQLNTDLFTLDDGTNPNLLTRLEEIYNEDHTKSVFYIINNVSSFVIEINTNLLYIRDATTGLQICNIEPAAFLISEGFLPNALVIHEVNTVEVVYLGRVYNRPATPTGYSLYSYGYGATPEIRNAQTIQYLLAFIEDSKVNPQPTPGEDPFAPGGTTGDDETDPTGGDGDFDNESDEIPIPLPPTAGAVDSGFITLYNPSMSQIQDLGSFMWSDLFDLDTFKKIFSDPMQAILGLSVVPVVPPRGASVNVKIGNIQSGVFMPTVTSQYVQKDFGQIALNEYWGGYLDYSPYTQVEIYLPFIGVRPLATDDVMGKTLHLVYNIDLLSGACMAFIAVNEDVLYQFIGQCSCSVPITGNDWTNVINGVLNIAGAIGTTIATGGLSAPQAVGAVTAVASSVVSSKPRVEKSGSLSGMGGMLGVFSPYLIITRPRQALPAGQNAFQGYPAFITRTLGSVTGFTRVTDIHLDGLTCTDAEKTEIKQLLEQGVIL